jgi:hypothetical protein
MSNILELLARAIVASRARAQGIPDWQAEMSAAVPDNLLADIVRDSRVPVTAADGATGFKKVSVAGAPIVTTGNDGAKWGGKGWQDAKSIDDWKPPGLDIMDRMMDQQDAIDREARARELAQLKRGGG